MSDDNSKFHETGSLKVSQKRLSHSLDELLSPAPAYRTTSIQEALNIIRRFSHTQTKKN